MKCMENKCKYYTDNCWCEIFEMGTKNMNCYGGFEKKEYDDSPEGGEILTNNGIGNKKTIL